MTSINLFHSQVQPPSYEKVRKIFISEKLKKAAILSTYALGVLSSSYLAYRNPKAHFFVSLGVIFLNIFSLPKILHHSKPKLLKAAIGANLFALGCTLLGGGVTRALIAARMIFTSLRMSHFMSALIFTQIVAGFVGFELPVFKEILRKSHQFFSKKKLIDRLGDLQKHYKELSVKGSKFSKEIMRTLAFYGSLVSFEGVLFFHHILFRLFRKNIISSQRLFGVELLTSRMCTQEHLSMDQFKRLIETMNLWSSSFFEQGMTAPDHLQKKLLLILKYALNSLSPNDLETAIPSILSIGSQVVPTLFTNEQFSQLFSQGILSKADNSIKKFLQTVEDWEKLQGQYDALLEKAKKLEVDIQGVNIAQLTSKEFSQYDDQVQSLNQTLQEFRKKIDEINFQKKHIAYLGGAQVSHIIVENSKINKYLNDQAFWKKINDVQRSITMVGQGSNRTLHDRFQYIKSKLSQFKEQNNEEEEEFSSVLFLAVQSAFVTKDYDALQNWLKLESKAEIDEALKKIGLEKKEDFYSKGIFSSSGKFSKVEILKSLKSYIDHSQKPIVQKKETKPLGKPKLTMKEVVKKVMRVSCHAMLSGLGVFPMLVSPIAGISGFTLGIGYLMLKRLKFPGMPKVQSRMQSFVEKIPGSQFYRTYFQNNQAITHTPMRMRLVDDFVNANVTHKMQIVFFRITRELFLHKLLFLGSPVHGFLQGINTANEVVHSFK